ncbi:hypothetical protein DXG01_014102 [Tephrocybe rancida]|nr:hypothetical protein DXG01_014102 [Tephrocybe rancida]
MTGLTSIHQKILPNHPADISVRHFSRRHAGMAAEGISARLERRRKHVGLAMQRGPTGRLERLALSTLNEVLVINMDDDKPLLTRDKPFEDLLRGNMCTLVGFDMGRLALRIAHDLKLQVRGIDLSTAFRANNWGPPFPSDVLKNKVFPNVDIALVDGMWIDEQGPRELCLRAWLSVCVVDNCSVGHETMTRVDTSLLHSQEVTCLGELVRQAYVLNAANPKESPSEFTRFQLTQDGKLELQNARYRTKIRRGNQTVIMTNESGREFYGQARGSKGRTTNIHFTGQGLTGTLEKVRVFGPPPLTNAEKARDEFVLNVLQGQALLGAPFIKSLWFPGRAKLLGIYSQPSTMLTFPGLNPSQTEVASKMISDCPLVVAHGPPGTGKTTTIAAAAAVWAQMRLPTWIIAHSNVAVKNMAEALFKKGVPFRILVSKDFHFEWHEHIYNNIKKTVIVSDELLAAKDPLELSRIIGGSCIMLSTLSMLSNPSLYRLGMYRVVPVGRLVVDEASQIKIEDFMHSFYLFRESLKKVCFFGDPKQLPPYGQEKLPEMKTIFDLPHLQGTAGFLDTQYRMPTPLGQFISKHVYDGKLKSEHNITTMSCVSFINVPNGAEAKSGFSWTNAEEIHVMTNIVRAYYKHTNFCIITPYDAQRSAIERRLKAEDLPWERVFNVDSFQGNEADFVLVSVVRSGSGPGFLSSINRMNVLLTRCRKGLVIVSNRSFIGGGGYNTLLGRLERHWTQIQGQSGTWVDWRAVSDGTADLPSAPGPNRLRAIPVSHRVPGARASSSSIVVKKFDVKSLFKNREPIPDIRTAEQKSPAAMYRAMFAFEGQVNEMSLAKDDIVELLEKTDGGWWSVKRAGVTGWAPKTFLEPVAAAVHPPSRPLPPPRLPVYARPNWASATAKAPSVSANATTLSYSKMVKTNSIAPIVAGSPITPSSSIQMPWSAKANGTMFHHYQPAPVMMPRAAQPDPVVDLGNYIDFPELPVIDAPQSTRQKNISPSSTTFNNLPRNSKPWSAKGPVEAQATPSMPSVVRVKRLQISDEQIARARPTGLQPGLSGNGRGSVKLQGNYKLPGLPQSRRWSHLDSWGSY